jgi:hypothetical protein
LARSVTAEIRAPAASVPLAPSPRASAALADATTMPNSPEYDRWSAACDAFVKKSVAGAIGQLLKGLEKPEAATILREEAAAGQCSEEEARRRLMQSVERDTKKKAIKAFMAKCVPRASV